MSKKKKSNNKGNQNTSQAAVKASASGAKTAPANNAKTEPAKAESQTTTAAASAAQAPAKTASAAQAPVKTASAAKAPAKTASATKTGSQAKPAAGGTRPVQKTTAGQQAGKKSVADTAKNVLSSAKIGAGKVAGTVAEGAVGLKDKTVSFVKSKTGGSGTTARKPGEKKTGSAAKFPGNVISKVKETYAGWPESKKVFWKGAGAGFGICAIIVAAWTIGSHLGRSSAPASLLSDSTRAEKVAYLQNLINEKYLAEADEEKLAEGVYTGLVYGLGDPYSRYFTADEYSAGDASETGSYVGLGVTMSKNADGFAEITDVYPGSAGEDAGIQAGDVIQAVDGTDISGMSNAEIVSSIRDGKESVSLTVYRPETDETMGLTVQLTEVEIPTVAWELLDGGIGLVKIDEFSGVTKGQYDKAVEALRGEGMQSLVVDLRGNHGGLVSSVCDILREILPEGLIVYTEDKDGNRVEENCDGENALDLPLAVLVDENSASASEIFAGAVQDYGVGTVIGKTTYGKGVVQTILPLSDGSAVQLTTAKYFTPNGREINETGITPDVEADTDLMYAPGSSVSLDSDGQLACAIEKLQEAA